MRLLFISRRFGYLRNFEGPILELARRGHALHLVSLAGDGKLKGTAMVERWSQHQPRITYERLPRRTDPEARIGLSARISMIVDYLRYLQPAYRPAPGLVERARQRTSSGFLRLLEAPPFRLRSARQVVAWICRRLEAAAPRRPEFDSLLRTQAPDVVLFTPLIALQSEEQDMLAAAVEQGLRTVFCVLSWDNLSSKAVIRTMPDLVTVWNDVQRDEARFLHRVPDDRIVVTGAQTFDHWFNRQPSRPRDEFLARVGLPIDRPFLLWVCSAVFRRTSPVEATFVRRWIEAIRASDDEYLRDVSILVRPHPSRLLEWANLPLDDLGPLSLWGANPVDLETRNDYFDSLFYSVAVVGLNTSAFLEAAIVGRPVYTVLLPEYHESQEGTLHFPYLLRVGGGLLHAARDMNAHLMDLAAVLRQGAVVAERSRRFVEAFIRPHGIETSATTRFVTAIEELMQRPARPPLGLTRPGIVFRPLYRWLESRSHHHTFRAWLTSPNEIEDVAILEAKFVKTRTREASKEASAAARDERYRLKEAGKEARAAARDERYRLKEEALQQHRTEKRSAARGPGDQPVPSTQENPH